jgi:hypothetical protein
MPVTTSSQTHVRGSTRYRQIAAEDPLIRHHFVRGAGAEDVREHADDAEERESH